jgi:hypothetical protein
LEARQVNGTQEAHDEDLAASSFMSFEEWKEMMLRKSGQDPANIKAHKPREQRIERDPSMNGGEGDSFGEDGEISLDFDALNEKVSEMASSSSGGAVPDAKEEAKEEQLFYDDGNIQYYRSKDAGKTCKERFSYASFDAGATVLKTSPGAKNAKAILVENKDSYMLLECRAKNKFVIVELSDDILVDTVVLANFEFFSSMIRKFRVSASDRYPVKLDKWVELGTFEARNSRDIQAFLVEHPQIFTKYIRIEFLTHYGNEFYCPVSLLRIHGTRMLDTWKEPSHDDEPEQIQAPDQEPVAEMQQVQNSSAGDNSSMNATVTHMPEVVTEMGLSPWQPVFLYNFSLETCEMRSPTTDGPTPVSPSPGEPAGNPDTVTTQLSAATGSDGASSSSSPAPAVAESPSSQRQSTSSSPSSIPSALPHGSSNSTASNPSSKQTADGHDPPTTPATTTTTSRNKTSSASSPPPASPTVQESFFKTVTKRLQLLESNTSLSLQYIEDQSRFLQEVLLKMERKQISRVDSFLDRLNNTVLSELRNVRTQYDQIWQSTVLALETQREQSQREIVALTSRLNVLADEVVFQKRMAILQSVLLLSCLILVIFSRGGFAQSLDVCSFPLPPGGGSSAYYRRYTGFGRSDSISGMSAASPGPAHAHARSDSISGQGMMDAVGRMDFSPPSPPPAATTTTTTSSSAAAALAASALPRRGYSSKSLPLTPSSSEPSRESTPAVVRIRSSGSPGSSPPLYEQEQERDQEEAREEVEIQQDEENHTPVRRPKARPRPPRGGQGETGSPPQTPQPITIPEEGEEGGEDRADVRGVEQQERERQQQHPTLARVRSTHSQLKPLPALPEDPS